MALTGSPSASLKRVTESPWVGTSRDGRRDAAVGCVHAYDATDGRRPSRLAVLGVLSGRSAQGGQDRRVPSPWHPHYARDPLGRPGGALERPGRSSDFVQSLVTSYSHSSGRTLESGSKHFPVARFTAILKPESGVLKRVSATKNLASTSWARGHTSLVATMLGSVDNNDF